MRNNHQDTAFDNQVYIHAEDCCEGPIANGQTQAQLNANVELGTSKRARWGNSWEFLMSCIAMSVGLGNIWRFPFTAYENGGGAFLIPYIIVLLVIGRPMYYMDMSLGQFSSRSNIKMFSQLAPAMKGVAYVQIFAAAWVSTYYCSLVALIIFYLVNSFTTDLPWTKCNTAWEIENTMRNVTCLAASDRSSFTGASNMISSSELWFTREVLKEQPQIDQGIGFPSWQLSICLFVGWACTFAVSVKGIHSSGKASYFLALFPYVIMIILLIRAVTLEGSAKGILYFISPDWEKILTAKIWYHAVTQCFFSLNVGSGSIVMYASFNNFNHNINRDAMVVTTLDTFTSLLAGATIFGILGNLAYELNVDIEDVVTSGGTGLVFISYPDAIAKFEYVPWVTILQSNLVTIIHILHDLLQCAKIKDIESGFLTTQRAPQASVLGPLFFAICTVDLLISSECMYHMHANDIHLYKSCDILSVDRAIELLNCGLVALFAILFFLMLFILGIGSLVALHNCINTAVLDNFPNLKSWKVSAGTAFIGFLIGLLYVTPGGQVILTIVDFYTGTFLIFMVGALQTITVMWWYGVENYCNDVEYMLKHKVAIFWRITWGIITPGLLIAIFIYFLATIPRLAYGQYTIPDYGLACGWSLVGIAIIIILYYIFAGLYKNRQLGWCRKLTVHANGALKMKKRGKRGVNLRNND